MKNQGFRMVTANVCLLVNVEVHNLEKKKKLLPVEAKGLTLRTFNWENRIRSTENKLKLGNRNNIGLKTSSIETPGHKTPRLLTSS